MDWIQNQSIYLLLDFFRQNKVCQKIRETSRFVVSWLVVGYPVSYRVFNNVLTQFRQLCWEYRLWFVLIFWVLCVHEIGKFMPNSSIFEHAGSKISAKFKIYTLELTKVCQSVIKQHVDLYWIEGLSSVFCNCIRAKSYKSIS